MMQGFKTKPRKYQLDTFNRTKLKKNFAVLWEQGLGKSKLSIDTACHLYLAEEIETVVVIVRKSITENWADVVSGEFFKHSWVDFNVYSWRGLKTDKEKRKLEDVTSNYDALQVLVINTEAFQSTSKDLKKKMTEILRKIRLSKTLVILDEATDIKTHDSNRTKLITDLFAGAKYRRLLTGTPIAEQPVDCYALYRWSHPGLWEKHGFKNFYVFRNYFCKMQEFRMGGKTFKKPIGYKNLDKLKSIILDPEISSRLTQAEVLEDLPEELPPQFIYTDLSPEQKRLYKTMQKDLYAEIEGEELELTSAMHKFMKLHQITCGVLHMEEEAKIIEGKNEKVSELLNMIENNLPNKTVVFSLLPSKKIIQLLQEKIEEKFGKGSCVAYTGDTPQDKRQEYINKFQDPDSEVKIFIGNNAAAMGITLTEATLQVYYSLYYSVSMKEQADKRCRRIGQKKPLTIAYLMARDTEDERIWKALEEKKKVIDLILETKKQ